MAAQSQNSYNLSLYDKPPSLEVNIDDFEDFAIRRLNVLRWIETQKQKKRKCLIRVPSRSTSTKHSSRECEYLEDIIMDKLMPCQWDNLSHFIARLAFTKSPIYSRWFVMQETTLFEYKCRLTTNQHVLRRAEQQLFRHITFPSYTLHDIILNDLHGRTPIPFFNIKNQTIEHTAAHARYFPFRVVPFQYLPTRFIAQRTVYIRSGYGFVPRFLFAEVLSHRYMLYLTEQMEKAKQALSLMDEDKNVQRELSKIIHVIKGLLKIYNECTEHTTIPEQHTEYKQQQQRQSKRIHCGNINQYTRFFPLCMRHTYESLLTTGHLKNNARLQLILFFKGIGLSLPESLLFFQRHFKKKQINFTKEYAYYIRYLYGNESGKKNYAPFDCHKIILRSTSGSSSCKDDHSGCPFTLFSTHDLIKCIGNWYGLSPEEISEHIPLSMNNVTEQAKCKELFKVLSGQKSKHRNECLLDIEDHPNNYFTAMQQLTSRDTRARRGPAKTECRTRPIKIQYGV